MSVEDKMRQIIEYIIHTLCIIVTAFGLILLGFLYLNGNTADEIMTINFGILMIAGLFQFGLTVLTSKKYLKHIINKDTKYHISNDLIRLIAWRQQINYFSIACVLMGVGNFIFYLLSPHHIDKTIFFSLIFILVPVVGFFESKKELKKYANQSLVDFKRSDDLLKIEIGEKSMEIKLDDLRYLRRINLYIIAQNSKGKEKLILPINDK